MPSNPTLQLRPCTSADIPALAILRHACFTAPSNKVVFRDVAPSDKLKYIEDGFRQELSGHRSVNFLCVVDTTTNEIISHAIWIYLPNGYLASEDTDVQHPWLPPGTNETLVRDFERMTSELRSADPRRKEPHWLLSYLATHPKHEGRGAGSMLIEWAFPRADEMGLRCFVDASTIGRPVYRKRGFEECVGVSELDLSRYEGGEGYEVQRWVAMVREPRVGESELSKETGA